ncbi:MAG: bestrophin family protein [Saprospiraceae bacterium]
MYVKHRFHIKEVHTGTWWNIISIMLISAIVVYLFHYERMTFLAIPLGVPMTLGTAISLILAFRTNASYGRWWEARKIWGAIVNDSRTLVRLVMMNYGTSEEDKALIKKLAYRQIAFNYALSRSLRKQEVISEIKKYLDEESLQFIQKHDNIPNALLLLHEKQLKEAHENGTFDTYEYTHLSEVILNLTNSMGKCERIKNTFFPTQYTFYIHLNILAFVIFLPFGLMAEIDFFAVLVAGMVAFLFLTIEQMAIDLQRPFANQPNDTSMTALSRTIEINILDMIEEEHELEKILPVDGVLM